MPAMQNCIADIKGKVEQAAARFIEGQTQKLEDDKARLQDLPEWGLLGTDDKVRLVAELETLTVEVSADLNGIKKLINDGYLFAIELSRIENEIKALAEKVGEEDENGDASVVDVILDAPKLVSSEDMLNDLIQKLQELKTQLKKGITIKITWR